MRVFAAYSHKGGTGKTTSLLMLANAASALGKKCLLLDFDTQQNFAMWKRYADEISGWDENLHIRYFDYRHTDHSVLEDALYNADEDEDFDYTLLNLPGIDHPLNRFALRFAELTILPFKPAATELVELEPALDVIRQLGEDGTIGKARVVFTMMYKGMWAAARHYQGEAIKQHTCMRIGLPETAVLADIVMRGVLHRTIADMSDARVFEIKRREELESALNTCIEFLRECDYVIDYEDSQGNLVAGAPERPLIRHTLQSYANQKKNTLGISSKEDRNNSINSDNEGVEV